MPNDDGFDDDRDDRPRRGRRRARDDDYGEQYDEPHRGGLILALGLVSLIACPVVGPFAWVMGSNDLRAMDEGRMDPEGKQLTQAGKIIGLVATIILTIQIVLLVLYVGVIVAVIAVKG